MCMRVCAYVCLMFVLFVLEGHNENKICMCVIWSNVYMDVYLCHLLWIKINISITIIIITTLRGVYV